MINHYKIFLALGLIVIILPFLGIPESWRVIMMFLVGIILIALSIVIRIQYKNLNKNEEEEIYIENKSSRMFDEDAVEDGIDEDDEDTSFENENPYLSGDDNRFENDEEE